MTLKNQGSTVSGNSTVQRKDNKYLGWVHSVSAAGALLLTTGCSSMLNVGSPDYACPGMPSGVQCMSARDVYTATNNGNVPLPMQRAGQEVGAKKATAAGAAADSVAPGGTQPTPNDVVSTYVAPRLPDQPIPIRTPAQVMRIWVAPWEGTNGDLNTTGYIYTEIEPRRWVIGDAVQESAPTLRPLQTIRYGNETRQEQADVAVTAKPPARATEATRSRSANTNP